MPALVAEEGSAALQVARAGQLPRASLVISPAYAQSVARTVLISLAVELSLVCSRPSSYSSLLQRVTGTIIDDMVLADDTLVVSCKQDSVAYVEEMTILAAHEAGVGVLDVSSCLTGGTPAVPARHGRVGDAVRPTITTN